MDGTSAFRALVVDDNGDDRCLLAKFLCRQGVHCDLAADGQEGLRLARGTEYDLVVTDLRMPGLNGHSLAVEVLAAKNPPAVMVVTGVVEPRIANDLRIRGVSDVIFKPADLSFVASRGAVLARERRQPGGLAAHRAAGCGGSGGRIANGLALDTAAESQGNYSDGGSFSNLGLRAGQEPLTNRLERMTERLPAPPKDYDAFADVSGGTLRSSEIVTQVELDPGLIVELLRMTNSLLYHSNRTVLELQAAQTESSWYSAPALITFLVGALSGWFMHLLSSIVWLS